MKQVNADNFDSVVLQSDKPVLVDFSAAWCGPCKMQKPVLERYAAGHPELEVVMIDVDESPTIGARYNVQAMPTLMLFRKGTVAAQVRGLQNESRISSLVADALSR